MRIYSNKILSFSERTSIWTYNKHIKIKPYFTNTDSIIYTVDEVYNRDIRFIHSNPYIIPPIHFIPEVMYEKSDTEVDKKIKLCNSDSVPYIIYDFGYIKNTSIYLPENVESDDVVCIDITKPITFT